MQAYIADTHSLLWYFSQPRLLGKDAQAAFEQVATNNADLLIPVIVIAELYYAIKKRSIKVDFNQILMTLGTSTNVHILDLKLEIIIECLKINSISEMHDRIIVAEAIKNQAVLITRDQIISASGLVQIIW